MWNIDRRRSLSSGCKSAVKAPAHGSVTAASDGFTLLEVMVALAILATAFAAALRLHSDSMGILLSARIHTKAAELAQFKMTEIEIAGLRDFRVHSGDFGTLAPDYLWEVQIEDTPVEFLKKVNVRVVNKHGGRAGEFELTEYMSDKAFLAARLLPREK
jgi:general secretion pathway protein I